jgi:Catechol dioxygenase N terminus
MPAGTAYCRRNCNAGSVLDVENISGATASRAVAAIKSKIMDELTSRREAETADALTEKVLEAYSGIDNVRLRDIVALLIRHLHAFAKEAKPTDKEFEIAWTLMAEMAKFTGDERNEFLLFCDVTRTRSGQVLSLPAIRGRARCRKHGCGQGSGAPEGEGNGNFRHGPTRNKYGAVRSCARVGLRSADAPPECFAM